LTSEVVALRHQKLKICSYVWSCIDFRFSHVWIVPAFKSLLWLINKP